MSCNYTVWFTHLEVVDLPRNKAGHFEGRVLSIRSITVQNWMLNYRSWKDDTWSLFRLNYNSDEMPISISPSMLNFLPYFIYPSRFKIWGDLSGLDPALYGTANYFIDSKTMKGLVDLISIWTHNVYFLWVCFL